MQHIPISRDTQQLVTEIMQRRTHPEQGFRSCLGVIRLGKRYTPQRLEKACERAVAIGAYTYKNVESILKNGLDRQPLTPAGKGQTVRWQFSRCSGCTEAT